MNTYLRVRTTASCEEWEVAFTPCLHLARRDVFDDEAAYYLSFVWLTFQCQIIFTRKMKKIPTGECNISVNEQDGRCMM